MSAPTDWMNGWIASEEAGNDTIAVKKIYIDVNEDNLFDGVLFSQIMYWHGKSRETGKSRLSVFRDGHYWLAKSYDDWKEECRIVGATARKCIRRIAARGLIIVKLYKFGGFPTVHIRVNWDVLESRIKSIRPVVSKGIDTTGQKGLIPQVKSITDTTADTTTEKKKTPKPPKGAVVDDSPTAQAVTDIIHAWLTATQTIEPNAYKNKSKRSDALFMHEQGVKAEIIGAWVKSLRRDEFWKNKAITWRKLTGEILPFMAHYKPVPVLVSEIPFQVPPERAKPDEIISPEEKEELRQMFENLVRMKDANG